MNKKFLIIFCTAGFLLVALAAALLIGSAGEWSPASQPMTTAGTAGETGASGYSTADGGSTDAAKTQQTGQVEETGEAPSFQVEFGVGEAPTFDAVAATANGQTDQSTQPLESSQPTQAQNPDGTPDATGGENGMPDKLLTYEEFLALSNAEQQEYFFLFADPLDYAQWLRQAQKDYEDGKTSITVTGPVDFGDIVP